MKPLSILKVVYWQSETFHVRIGEAEKALAVLNFQVYY